MASSATCEGLVTQDDGSKQVKKQIDMPKPGEHQLLIKVSHVAQNPTDVQAFDLNMFGDGTVLGCDFVGTVVTIGDKVRSDIAVGETVAGLIWGGEYKGLGGYSEYTLADDRICFRVPKGQPLDAMTTVPLAACTSWLALYSTDQLNIDRAAARSAKTPVLIWGGSSSVGLYAIQLATLHGLDVITTCSPKHFAMVKGLGATHVFDYRSPEVVDEIKKVAPTLKHAFDTIGKEGTSATASRAMDGGTLCTVRPGKALTEDVTEQTKVTDVLVWTAFLKEHRYKSFVWPANEGDHGLGVELFSSLPGLIEEGKIKPNPTKVYKNGLDDVPKGFQEHRDGKISGYKIVYEL